MENIQWRGYSIWIRDRIAKKYSYSEILVNDDEHDI
jgi:hypothetical protein